MSYDFRLEYGKIREFALATHAGEKEGRRGGRMRFAKLVNEFRDGEGAVVAEQVTTVVETARPPA